jgi:hypothetical protein
VVVERGYETDLDLEIFLPAAPGYGLETRAGLE